MQRVTDTCEGMGAGGILRDGLTVEMGGGERIARAHEQRITFESQKNLPLWSKIMKLVCVCQTLGNEEDMTASRGRRLRGYG